MLELLKAPCLLFKVQWLVGLFSLIIQCTSVRQSPPYRSRSRKHPGAKHSYARGRFNVQPDTSVKDALTHLEEQLLMDTGPVQVREQGAHQCKALTALCLALAAEPWGTGWGHQHVQSVRPRLALRDTWLSLWWKTSLLIRVEGC